MYDQKGLKIIHSRDVTFNELAKGIEKESQEEPAQIENPHIVIDFEDDSLDECNSLEEEKQDEASHTGSEERTDSTTVRRSQRQTRRPDYYGVWANTTTALSEPNTVKEALSCPEKEDWKEAMEAEYKSLCANQVWDLVPPPENCKIISSKWVYKCKRGENGDIEITKQGSIGGSRVHTETWNRL